MNDKDRDLIKQVLQAAGQTGEKGFTYLVKYKFLDGLTDVIAGGIILAFCVWAFRRAFAWKPRQDEGHIARAGLLVLLAVVGVFALCGVLTGLVTMLAPEGAAIHSVLSR